MNEEYPPLTPPTPTISTGCSLSLSSNIQHIDWVLLCKRKTEIIPSSTRLIVLFSNKILNYESTSSILTCKLWPIAVSSLNHDFMACYIWFMGQRWLIRKRPNDKTTKCHPLFALQNTNLVFDENRLLAMQLLDAVRSNGRNCSKIPSINATNVRCFLVWFRSVEFVHLTRPLRRRSRKQ